MMLSVNRALATLLALSAALVVGCAPKKDSCHLPSLRCGDHCVDVSSDPSNCGGCGVVCGAGQTCCGSCVDLQTSVANCGACRHSCLGPGVASGDASCAAGVCQCTGPTATDCDGTCANTAVDRAHCGDCTTACTFAGSQCQGGACGCFVPDPVECTSAVSSHPACTDLNDPQNCGTCGVGCTAPGKTACPAGNCSCASGNLTDCGSAGCFDLQTDAANCRTCGNACAAGQLCCAAICTSVATDNAACGACGNVCTSPKSCQNGSCTCPPTIPTACAADCCAGTACCGSGSSAKCQTAHDNGLGQPFFDCTASYTPSTTTPELAKAAAAAWGATSTSDASTLCGPFCTAGQKAGACAVWCYGSNPFAGHVATAPLCVNACPTSASPSWPVP